MADVNNGHSNVPALRKDRSCCSCCAVLRRHGLPALPNAAGSLQRKPHVQLNCGSLSCRAGVLAYTECNKYPRLRASSSVCCSRLVLFSTVILIFAAVLRATATLVFEPVSTRGCGRIQQAGPARCHSFRGFNTGFFTNFANSRRGGPFKL
jgi:hypothetical protein